MVAGSGKFDFEGLPLSHEERYELTREWLAAFRAAFGDDAVNFKGKHIHIENGKALLPSVQRPYPPIYFGGSSDEARSVAAEHVDVYLSWGERPDEVAEKFADVRKQAEERGRRVRFGLRAHIIVRETEEEAWREADRLIEHLTDEQIAKAQAGFAASESVGQQRMARLHHGSRESLRIGQNLWAGGGAGARRRGYGLRRQPREHRPGIVGIPQGRRGDFHSLRVSALGGGVPHGGTAVSGDW